MVTFPCTLFSLPWAKGSFLSNDWVDLASASEMMNDEEMDINSRFYVKQKATNA